MRKFILAILCSLLVHPALMAEESAAQKDESINAQERYQRKERHQAQRAERRKTRDEKIDAQLEEEPSAKITPM